MTTKTIIPKTPPMTTRTMKRTQLDSSSQNIHKKENKVKESRKNSFINNKTQSKTYQKPFKRDLCKYYLNGVCTKGDNCTYSHIIKDFPCKYYITLGSCDNKECR